MTFSGAPKNTTSSPRERYWSNKDAPLGTQGWFTTNSKGTNNAADLPLTNNPYNKCGVSGDCGAGFYCDQGTCRPVGNGNTNSSITGTGCSTGPDQPGVIGVKGTSCGSKSGSGNLGGCYVPGCGVGSVGSSSSDCGPTCCRYGAGSGEIGCWNGKCPPSPRDCSSFCTGQYATYGKHSGGCGSRNACDECFTCVDNTCVKKEDDPCYCDPEPGDNCGRPDAPIVVLPPKPRPPEPPACREYCDTASGPVVPEGCSQAGIIIVEGQPPVYLYKCCSPSKDPGCGCASGNDCGPCERCDDGVCRPLESCTVSCKDYPTEPSSGSSSGGCVELAPCWQYDVSATWVLTRHNGSCVTAPDGSCPERQDTNYDVVTISQTTSVDSVSIKQLCLGYSLDACLGTAVDGVASGSVPDIACDCDEACGIAYGKDPLRSNGVVSNKLGRADEILGWGGNICSVPKCSYRFSSVQGNMEITPLAFIESRSYSLG